MNIQEINDQKFFIPAALASVLGYDCDIIVETVEIKENPVILLTPDDDFLLGSLDSFVTPSGKTAHYIETANGNIFINPETYFIVGHIKNITVCNTSDYEHVLDAEFSNFLQDLDSEFSEIKIAGSRKFPAQPNAPTLADVPHSRPAQKGKPKNKKRQ